MIKGFDIIADITNGWRYRRSSASRKWRWLPSYRLIVGKRRYCDKISTTPTYPFSSPRRRRRPSVNYLAAYRPGRSHQWLLVSVRPRYSPPPVSVVKCRQLPAPSMSHLHHTSDVVIPSIRLPADTSRLKARVLTFKRNDKQIITGIVILIYLYIYDKAIIIRKLGYYYKKRNVIFIKRRYEIRNWQT